MRLQDGHTVTPQTQAIYGKPPNTLNTTDPGTSSFKGTTRRSTRSSSTDSSD
ncbi:hypothetical protein [Acetobacter papayae]|uniref:hypothetical protein n=1 Tax=Acetobacter papayae TaxID=1076592 RepID=UPI0038CD3CE6